MNINLEVTGVDPAPESRYRVIAMAKTHGYDDPTLAIARALSDCDSIEIDGYDIPPICDPRFIYISSPVMDHLPFLLVFDGRVA